MCIRDRIIADFTDIGVSPEKIKKRLERINEVLRVEILNQSAPGLLIDSTHFPLTLLGERVFIMSKGVYKALIKDIRDEWGSAGEVFLYHIGNKVGEDLVETYSWLFRSQPLNKAIENLANFSMNFGFLIPEIVKLDLDRGEVIVRAHASFECELGKGVNKSYSQFVRGIIAGIMRKIFKVENVFVEETRCVAAGDPYCEFEITLKKRVNANKKILE